MTWRRAFAPVDAHPLWAALLITATAFLLADHAHEPADFALFAQAGRALLAGDFAGVYADPAVQTGPITLAAMAMLDRLVRPLGRFATPVLIAVMCASVVACLVHAVRRGASGGAARGLGVVLAGLLALMTATAVLTDAHPTYAAVPLLWFLAALAVQRDSPMVAGLLLGLGAGLEVWALLGIGVFAALQGWRRLAGATLAAGLTGLALWLPFVLSGSFRMLSYQWQSAAGSVPHLLFGPGPVPWSWRVAQGLVAALAGVTLARHCRRSAHLAWLFPAMVGAVRLIGDPVWYRYYEIPVSLMLITGLGWMVARRGDRGQPLRVRQQLEDVIVDPRRAAASPALWASLALAVPPVLRLWIAPQYAHLFVVACLGVLTALLVPSRDYGAALPHRG